MRINRLGEASVAILVHIFTDDSVSFAIISVKGLDNGKALELKKDVESRGFGFTEFIGRWIEGGSEHSENSLLIPNISFKKAFGLGRKYEQPSIVYKDRNGCAEYCTTPFDDYSAGDVVRLYYFDKDRPLNTASVKELFFTAFDIKENFELYVKEFINSRLGFTEHLIDNN